MLSLWTGIPVYKLTEEETERLLKMEENLHKRIIGQESAVAAVSQSIRRTRAGLEGPEASVGFVHLPRPHRRRQDRARQDAHRVPVR